MFLGKSKKIYKIFKWPCHSESEIFMFASGSSTCIYCGNPQSDHGIVSYRYCIDKFVCPGDYIVVYNDVVVDICHEEDFHKFYEQVL
jgi:hypothetical protein